MKKAIIQGSTIILTFILCFASINYADAEEFDRSSIYRLHIIANSDSVEDQNVKLKVRDAVLRYEKQLFGKAVLNKNGAKALLMENGADIIEIAENTLRSNGFDYGVRLSTGTYTFPDRQYEDRFYPAGDYDALRIVLGEGKGKNWWCVMFPPLCINETDSTKTEDTEQKDEKKEFKSFFVTVFEWIKGLFD